MAGSVDENEDEEILAAEPPEGDKLTYSKHTTLVLVSRLTLSRSSFSCLLFMVCDTDIKLHFSGPVTLLAETSLIM